MVKKLYIKENDNNNNNLQVEIKRAIKDNGFKINDAVKFVDFCYDVQEGKEISYLPIQSTVTTFPYQLCYNPHNNNFAIKLQVGSWLYSEQLEKLRKDIHPLSTLVDKLNEIIQ